MIRQPIVSVLGHVDHGKTTLLDSVRGTRVASREPGAITQHIGATEVPLDAILNACGPMVKGRTFKVPGLLFIDTPGHHAFSTLRARGGSLADLAVLVVDINEGFKPQTTESLGILRRYRTPFVVAANKVDLIPGWRVHPGQPLATSLGDQPEATLQELDERLYSLAGRLYQEGFSADRYDRISDFTKNVAMVPLSAKHSEGIPDLLLMLVGLAQRFLEEGLRREEGLAEGTILEIREEKGFGPTLDAIIYKGTIFKGDTIVLGTTDAPIVTKVKALLKPKPLDEIRDPENRFDSVDSVSAAAGIKVAASGLEGAVAGAPLRVAGDDLEGVKREVLRETSVDIPLHPEGVMIKADAIGSLEGLSAELKRAGIAPNFARLGPVSRRDIIDAATTPDPLRRVVLAFNVPLLPDAEAELAKQPEVKVVTNNIIYKLIEDYQAWLETRKRELEEASRKQIVYPGKVLVLRDHIFRVSKPAIVGVRVLAGRVRPGQELLRNDGRPVGKVRSLRSGERALPEARAGSELAMAIEGATVGRQFDVEEVLYVDIPESHVKELDRADLNLDEREALDKVKEIRRRLDPFWGM
jgi:translation initiation factor 5B